MVLMAPTVTWRPGRHLRYLCHQLSESPTSLSRIPARSNSSGQRKAPSPASVPIYAYLAAGFLSKAEPTLFGFGVQAATLHRACLVGGLVKLPGPGIAPRRSILIAWGWDLPRQRAAYQDSIQTSLCLASEAESEENKACIQNTS